MRREIPMRIGVEAKDDHVVLIIGCTGFGLDIETARAVAESLYSAIGNVEGTYYFVTKLTPGGIGDGEVHGGDERRGAPDRPRSDRRECGPDGPGAADANQPR